VSSITEQQCHLLSETFTDHPQAWSEGID